MTRRAVLILPGRGTYNKAELGYLARHHRPRADLIAGFDAQRAAAGQQTVSALDGAKKFNLSHYSRGDIASGLIAASALADVAALAADMEIVAVTGNSMGWYLALAAGGAVTPQDGFHIVNTMGTLMQAHLIGGQVVYPWMGSDWRTDAARKAALLETVAQIDAQPGQVLRLSIDLGGMLVLAGDAAGLAAFEKAVPQIDGRFPMRLAGHAGFHTELQAPVAALGRAALKDVPFGQPKVPLIDGRGAIWWPGATDPGVLRDYTLGHQVTETYDFTAAIRMAAREFAPDLFIVTGPGGTLGGAVAQSLVACGWRGMASKADFERVQGEAPLLVSMGRADQRALVI
jgi:[acyl-carrier-protein] S-malonyltransferase